MLNGDLNEAKSTWSLSSARARACTTNAPLPQRQIRRPRARTQALRRAADDDRDRLPCALLEDVRARVLAHGADAEREQDLAVERHTEVGREREQVRHDAGELRGEAGRCAGRERRVEERARGGQTFCGECAHGAPGRRVR